MLLNISASLCSAGWLPLLAKLMPLERRGKVFASRNLIQGITVTVVTFLRGRWLKWRAQLTPATGTIAQASMSM